MDKRLILEILPGPAFILGDAIGGVFVGAGVSALATGLAIVLRWRWDRILPLMAISIFALTAVMLLLGLAFDDTTFVKVSATIGSLIFAGILVAGMWLRPSLLQRTLGYKIQMGHQGWQILHGAWIALALARGVANEAVWRLTSDQVWVIYNGLADFVWFGLIFGITYWIAWTFWDDTQDTASL
ncbi:MAG: septation protein IspZ [Pseudomonadota bacterium]